MKVFRYPLYCYLRLPDGNENSYTNIEPSIWTAPTGEKVFLLWEDEEEAKSQAVMLNDNRFELKHLGEKGFMKFLKDVVTPRGINLMVLNIDTTSDEDHKIATYRIDQFIIDDNKYKPSDN